MSNGNDQARSRALWCSTAIAVVGAGFATQIVINGSSGSLTYQLGAVCAFVLMIGVVPAIVALITKFRRPGLVMTVCVPVVLFFIIGSVGSRRIEQGTLGASGERTAVAEPTAALALSPVARSAERVERAARVERAENNEQRCTRWSPNTGDCVEASSPPPGYHWEDTSTKAEASANAVPAWDDLTPVTPQDDAGVAEERWSADVAVFFQRHTSMNYQHNAALMQEKLDTGPASGLTNAQVLANAFYAAEADSRWSNGP